MTVTEFNREFDILYNNIMSNMAPGLDEYEKSVFLTQAQEAVVTQLYDGTLGDGFESKELNRRYLANLIKKATVSSPTSTNVGQFLEYDIAIASDVLVLIAEQAKIASSDCCNSTKIVNVVPIKYDELNKIMNNPFRRPNNNKVLRLDKDSHDVYIISKRQVSQYIYEYLAKPAPIVLANLGTLSVDGVSTPQTSALDSSLHRTILKYAVQLAAASWASNNKS